MKFARQDFLELIRYGLVSAAALVVDAGLLGLLHFGLGLHYLLAASLSFIAGGVVAYVLSIRFVFRHRRRDSHAVDAPLFIGLGLVGLAVNTIVMLIVVGRLAAPVLAGKICAAGATFFVNYFLRRTLLFSPGRSPAAAAATASPPTRP